MSKLPTIKEVSALIRAIKPDIGDEYVQEGDTLPSIHITIGHNPETGAWSYQTGDNSYTGGAYGYPNWAVGDIYRRTNSRELASDLINQLSELIDDSVVVAGPAPGYMQGKGAA